MPLLIATGLERWLFTLALQGNPTTWGGCYTSDPIAEIHCSAYYTLCWDDQLPLLSQFHWLSHEDISEYIHERQISGVQEHNTMLSVPRPHCPVSYSSNKAGFWPESRSISVQPNFHGHTIALQDLNPGEVFPPGSIVLTVVTYIGASVSVLCLLVTVVTYSAAKWAKEMCDY